MERRNGSEKIAEGTKKHNIYIYIYIVVWEIVVWWRERKVGGRAKEKRWRFGESDCCKGSHQQRQLMSHCAWHPHPTGTLCHLPFTSVFRYSYRKWIPVCHHAHILFLQLQDISICQSKYIYIYIYIYTCI